MTTEMPLHQYLPESLWEYEEEIQDLTSYYVEYLETLIEYGEVSFRQYLKMEGREDLIEIKDEIASADIHIEYSVDADLIGYRNSEESDNSLGGKIRMVLR
jgi:hypothetical protein